VAFGDLNAAAVARATDRLGARARWQIGTPYAGEEVPVLLVRARRRAAAPAEEVESVRLPKPRGPLLALRLGDARDAYPEVLPLDRIARAIVEAYVALGDISAASADSLALTPRAGGTVRCALTAGDARENGLLAAALEEAISPALGQRYVVSRPVWPNDRSAGAVAWRALTFRPPLDVSWYPVPSDLGTHKDRALVFHGAWRRWVGPGELLFAGREASAGREQRAAAAAARAEYVASRRVLWH
jgi:hypothetical protein